MTGATSGIGLVLASGFAAAGARVTAVGLGEVTASVEGVTFVKGA